MTRNRISYRSVILIGLAVVYWMLASGLVLAGEAGSGGEPKLKAQPFILSYAVVIILVGLGVFLVCLPSRRRERVTGAAAATVDASELIEEEQKVPQVMMGMREAQVERMLGKPRVRRRGEEIFAELAQTGQLSEEEAAKVYAVYDHPAGRYEIVFLDRRVVEIRRQPSPEKKPAEAP
ncbi:MAG TPA: hypothetical protein EYP56_04775 [Planctomycetaceae bacterium]|nr:hypothetical protein [Planctomycetaceae bacterium]HIQ19869.1 hypothetical protein [Planctomycetota bacterium]